MRQKYNGSTAQVSLEYEFFWKGNIVAQQEKSKRKNYIVFTLVMAGLLLTIELTQMIGMSKAYQKMYQQSDQQLSNLVSYIDNILARFDRVPSVLSTQPVLAQALLFLMTKPN